MKMILSLLIVTSMILIGCTTKQTPLYIIQTGSTGNGSDNTSWNEARANTLYIAKTNETNLNVNSSYYWNDFYDIIGPWIIRTNGFLDFNGTKINNEYYKTTNPLGYYNSSTLPANTEPLWTANSTLYYLKSNPLSFYNSSTFIWTEPLWTANSTLYYLKSNPLGYYNVSTAGTSLDPLWNGNSSIVTGTASLVRNSTPTISGAIISFTPCTGTIPAGSFCYNSTVGAMFYRNATVLRRI